MIRTVSLFFLVLVTIAGAIAVWPSQPRATSIERLYAAYASGDYQVIQRTVTSQREYELLRAGLGRAVEQWKRKRHPKQAVFMIEFALVGFNHEWPYWLDVLDRGRGFITDRPDPPGQNPGEDRFEIAWHKTAVALLEGIVRPDIVERYGVSPIGRRMKPEPSPDGGICLIDPWIELLRGFVEEQWTISSPSNLAKRGPVALRHYEAAGRYGSTRAEAVTRASLMLVRLGRPAEALAALEGLGDPVDDPAVRYWRRLFRGRALEAIGRLDEASRAYEDALALVPHAQAPAVALTALEMRRNRFEQAFTWAAAVRTAPLEMADPWWDYPTGDYRLLRSRLISLRAASR